MASDFFPVNLYLDENEDYVISPAYYNGGDDTINIAYARAEEITMITYSGEPVDQGVSLLGVSFGREKNMKKVTVFSLTEVMLLPSSKALCLFRGL